MGPSKKIGLVLLLFPIYSWASSFKSYVDEPKACLVKKAYPCAIRFLSNKSKFISNQLKIFTHEGSVLIIYNARNFRIVEGKFWVRTEGEAKIESGLVQVKGQGDFWVETALNSKVIVRNLKGTVSVESPALLTKVSIPMGFENWYSVVNSAGGLQSGLLKGIDAIAFLPEWYRLAKLPSVETKEILSEYRQSWQGAVAASSEFYRSIIQRNVASNENRENQKQIRSLNEAQERKRLRQMFRDRNTIELR